MKNNTALQRDIHPDFRFHLDFKDEKLISLYKSLRQFILEHCPYSNELLYNTHALTSVYSVSDKLGDAFCMIPIYSNHLNLGFNKGTLLQDPKGLLQGTGKLIRHIPVTGQADFDNPAVKTLLQSAMHFAINDADKKITAQSQTISKIKR